MVPSWRIRSFFNVKLFEQPLVHVKTQRLWDLEWRSRRGLVAKDRGHSTHTKAGALVIVRGSLRSLGVCGTTTLASEEPVEEVFAYGVVEGCENEVGV